MIQKIREKTSRKTAFALLISMVSLIPIVMGIFSILVWWNTKDVRAQVKEIEASQKYNKEELKNKADNTEVQLRFDNIKDTLETFQDSYKIEIDSLKQSNEHLNQSIRDLNQNLTNILLYLNKNGG